MKKTVIPLVASILFMYACTFPFNDQGTFDASGALDGNSAVVRAVKTSGWASEGERIINDARQHASQRPYGNSDGGWKKNSYDSNGQPIGQQLMYAASPYLPSGWSPGLDCVGLVHVVFTETGHGTKGPYSRVVAGRQNVYKMYTYYRDTPPRGCTLDAKLQNHPTSEINDTNAKLGDIIILRTPDYDSTTKKWYPPSSAPSGSNCAHVGIYSGDRYMINMTSDDVKEGLVRQSLGYDKTNKIYYNYYIAAVVHTGLAAMNPQAGTNPPPPLDLSHVLFDTTGYFVKGGGGADYHPLLPFRLMDSRSSLNATKFSSGKPQTIMVAKGYTVNKIPTNATAVTGNVTVVNPSAAGYVAVSSGGALASGATTSSVNFKAGDIRAGELTVMLVNGKMDIEYVSSSSSATADIIFDVTGYYANDIGSTYIPIVPFRAMDTRQSSAFKSKAPKTFQLSDWCSANGLPNPPINTTAVTGNVTIVKPTAAGYALVAPGHTLASGATTSTINFPAGDIIANGVTVMLQGGAIDILYVASKSSATTNIIFDVTGYFVSDASGSTYIPLKPFRALDTRKQGNTAALKSREVFSFQLADGFFANSVPIPPTSATAVTGNVTVVQPMNLGYVTVGTGGLPSPLLSAPSTSTINFPALDVRAHGVTTMLRDGKIDFIYMACPNLVVR